MPLTEQEEVRRQACAQLRELGIDPYPAAAFETTHTTGQVREQFSEDEADRWQNVRLAGRLMLKRVMGKASFVELQDAHGRLQLYIRRDDLCPGEDNTFYNRVFKKLLDIGDFIGVEGFVFITKTGETTLHVQQLTLLSKSLRPLPIAREKDGQSFDGFTDAEQRYRQRYVDLVVNPDVRDRFRARSQIIQNLRRTMTDAGYLEVETPVLQPIYGGAAAQPFTTRHESLGTTLFLRISNELYLKRLIVGGYDGVFEFSRNFRNEGMDRSHNPEFTCMELYVAYKDYEWMMAFTERMVEAAVKAVHGTTMISYDGQTVDFSTPWRRLSMAEAVQEHAGIDIATMTEDDLRRAAEDHGIEIDASMGKGKLIDEIFGATCEHRITNPTFITDYPIEMSPLAKRHREHEGFVERFETICMGMEICNAFSELNDPQDQRERFEAQAALRAHGDDEAMVLDEDYLRAMEYGMPPTAGLGIGIDRLVMLLTDSHSIQEVLLFPHMRPEQGDDTGADDDETP